MLNITNELKKKLLAAQSEDEVLEILKEAGQEVTEEDLSHLWEEIKKLAVFSLYYGLLADFRCGKFECMIKWRISILQRCLR